MPFPAVFIEFLPSTYNTHIDNIQTGEGTIRIHIIEFELNKTDEQILDLRDTVHIALQGLRPSEDSFSPLVRIGETPDGDFGNVLHWILDYSCIWNDDPQLPRQSASFASLALSKTVGL